VLLVRSLADWHLVPGPQVNRPILVGAWILPVAIHAIALLPWSVRPAWAYADLTGRVMGEDGAPFPRRAFTSTRQYRGQELVRFVPPAIPTVASSRGPTNLAASMFPR